MGILNLFCRGKVLPGLTASILAAIRLSASISNSWSGRLVIRFTKEPGAASNRTSRSAMLHSHPVSVMKSIGTSLHTQRQLSASSGCFRFFFDCERVRIRPACVSSACTPFRLRPGTASVFLSVQRIRKYCPFSMT